MTRVYVEHVSVRDGPGYHADVARPGDARGAVVRVNAGCGLMGRTKDEWIEKTGVK